MAAQGCFRTAAGRRGQAQPAMMWMRVDLGSACKLRGTYRSQMGLGGPFLKSFVRAEYFCLVPGFDVVGTVLMAALGRSPSRAGLGAAGGAWPVHGFLECSRLEENKVDSGEPSGRRLLVDGAGRVGAPGLSAAGGAVLGHGKGSINHRWCTDRSGRRAGEAVRREAWRIRRIGRIWRKASRTARVAGRGPSGLTASRGAV